MSALIQIPETAGSAEESSFRSLQSCIEPELQCQSGRVTSLAVPGPVRRSKGLASVEYSTSIMNAPHHDGRTRSDSTEAGIPRLFNFAIVAMHALLRLHSRNWGSTTETAAVSEQQPHGGLVRAASLKPLLAVLKHLSMTKRHLIFDPFYHLIHPATTVETLQSTRTRNCSG